MYIIVILHVHTCQSLFYDVLFMYSVYAKYSRESLGLWSISFTYMNTMYTATGILKTRCIINILILCVYHVQVIFSIHMYLFTEINLQSLFSDGVLVCKLKTRHVYTGTNSK